MKNQKNPIFEEADPFRPILTGDDLPVEESPAIVELKLCILQNAKQLQSLMEDMTDYDVES